jgi:hyperosmotically inducible periplasmic protein
MKTSSLLIAAVFAALSAAACDRMGTQHTVSTTTTPGTTSATTTNPPSSTATTTADTTSPSTPAAASASTPATGNNSANVVSDTIITGKVKTAITADNGMKDSDISVKTENGMVTLTGTVKSPDQVTLASALAQRQEGVSRVENQVAVK